MPDDDLAQRAARHVMGSEVLPSGTRVDYCMGCGQPWPCDAHQLAAALAAEQAARAQTEDLLARAREHFVARHGIDCGFLMPSPSLPDDMIEEAALAGEEGR